MHPFIELIEEQRKLHNISVRQLCEKAGVNRITYSKMRHASKTLDSIEALLDLLGWELDAIKVGASKVITEAPSPGRYKTCKVVGCDNTHEAKGYCQKHYSRLRKRKVARAPSKPKPRMCTVDGCNSKHEAKGFCAKHYHLWRRDGDRPPSKSKHAEEQSLVDPDSFLVQL